MSPDDRSPSRPPTLVLYPRHDADFVGLATALVADGHHSPAGLQAKLREHHPGARVHARELSGEPHVVLYVYRDGQWTRD